MRALVTGGASGLGLALTKALLAQGDLVVVGDLAESRPESVPGDAAYLTLDVRSERDWEAARDWVDREWGRLDLLVNNAAVNVERPLETTDDAHWDLHLAVCLKAPFFVTRAALPPLRAARGSVVNIASELGLHAIANNVAYVSAKHGLVALTRALGLELAGEGIRVNALCPGTLDTELMRDCAAASPDPAAYYAAFRAYHPLGRLASPREIALFVLTLATPAAAFMTGSAIALDGGSTAGRR